MAEPKDDGKKEDVEFPEEWAEHMSCWLEGKSLNTVKQYPRHIKTFFKFLIKEGYPTELEKIKLFHMKKFRSFIIANHVPTIRRPMFAAVKSFWKHLYGDEVIPRNVASNPKLPPKPAPTTLERKLTPDEVKAIFDGCIKLEEQVLLTLLYYGGFRVSEAVKMTWDNITFSDDKKSCVVSVIGKGAKFRSVPLNCKATEVLLKYKATRPEGYLFKGRKKDTHIVTETGTRRVKRIATRAGYPDVTPHWLRHSYASHSLQAGCDIGTVSKQLGHSSIATTSGYIHAARKGASEYLI